MSKNSNNFVYEAYLYSEVKTTVHLKKYRIELNNPIGDYSADSLGDFVKLNDLEPESVEVLEYEKNKYLTGSLSVIEPLEVGSRNNV
jgi:hypothetical protein